jgi:hypothetical protein
MNQSEQEIIEAIQEQEQWLNLPTMTEEELREVEIPEDRMFRTFRINYNRHPSTVRLVRARDGSITINVDFVQNLYYVRERINRLMLQLGELTYRRLS